MTYGDVTEMLWKVWQLALWGRGRPQYDAQMKNKAGVVGKTVLKSSKKKTTDSSLKEQKKSRKFTAYGHGLMGANKQKQSWNLCASEGQDRLPGPLFCEV